MDSGAPTGGSALSPTLPGGEVARAEASLWPRRPARRGDREPRQLRRRDVHRAGRDRQLRRCKRRSVRGARPHRRAPVELWPRRGGRARRGRGGGHAPGCGCRGRRRRRPATGEGRHALGDRGSRRDRGRAGRVAVGRARRAEAGLRAVRLGRRGLRRSCAERAHAEPAARDRGAPDRARVARRDRRRLRRDGARRRQLRARLGLDRLDGRGARRARSAGPPCSGGTGSTRCRARAASTSRKRAGRWPLSRSRSSSETSSGTSNVRELCAS